MIKNTDPRYINVTLTNAMGSSLFTDWTKENFPSVPLRMRIKKIRKTKSGTLYRLWFYVCPQVTSNGPDYDIYIAQVDTLLP